MSHTATRNLFLQDRKRVRHRQTVPRLAVRCQVMTACKRHPVDCPQDAVVRNRMSARRRDCENRWFVLILVSAVCSSAAPPRVTSTMLRKAPAPVVPANTTATVKPDAAVFRTAAILTMATASDNDCENDTACACPPDLQTERCACFRGDDAAWSQRRQLQWRGIPNPTISKAQLSASVAAKGAMPPAYKDVLGTPQY